MHHAHSFWCWREVDQKSGADLPSKDSQLCCVARQRHCMYTYVTCDVYTYTRRRAGETRWWRERCVERNISVYLGWDVECIVYAETCDSSVYHWRLNQKFKNSHKESRENNKSGKFNVSWKASIFNNPISLLCLWYVHVLWVSLVLRWGDGWPFVACDNSTFYRWWDGEWVSPREQKITVPWTVSYSNSD